MASDIRNMKVYRNYDKVSQLTTGKVFSNEKKI